MKTQSSQRTSNGRASVVFHLGFLSLAMLCAASAMGCFVGQWFGGGDLPRIAYIAGDGEDARAWVSQPGQADPVRISPRDTIVKAVRWSPGQRYLAWVTGGEVPLLMLYDFDEEETRVLVSGVDESQPPIWAPDADRIAYVSATTDAPDIYMVELETGEETRLTFSDARETIGGWSPDGQWLVFTQADHDGLLLRNPNGVNLIELTDGADSDPVWSPKGDRIAFLRDSSEDQDIYVLRPTKSDDWADDTDELAVANAEYDETDPSWSADGRRLAFVVRFDDQSEIFTVLVDGTERKQLTYNTAEDLMPDWSQSGDKIAFVSFAYGNSEILYMNRDGTEQTRLTANQAADTEPDW